MTAEPGMRMSAASTGPNWMDVLKPPLTIRLCQPRGFCAGVDRAIQIVVLALKKYGAPVYVRHEIVHNRHVVERLKGMGAVFVKELDDCPDDRPVVFSAHGVPKSVPATARSREMLFLDATCPLVSKVHVEAERAEDGMGHGVLLKRNMGNTGAGRAGATAGCRSGCNWRPRRDSNARPSP